MRLSYLPVILLLSFSTVFAAFDDNTPTRIPEVFEWQRSGMNARVIFDAPALSWGRQEDGTVIPLLAGAGEEFVAGAPQLPLYSKLVAVPAGMDVRIANVTVEWEDAGINAITHDPGSSPELPGELDTWEPAPLDIKKYTEVSERSSQTATIGQTGRWRDIRVAQLTIRPLRYDASTGQTDLASEVEIELEFITSADIDGYDPPGVSEAMYKLYNAYVLGAGDELDEDEVMRGTYLIICRPALVDLMAPLVEWRTKCGFNVIVATTDQTGTTDTLIHDYIDDIYEDEDTPLDYVLLFGDTDQPFAIPTYHIPGSPAHNQFIPTNHKYTIDLQLDQSVIANVLPRYLIGRLSVDTNTQATVVINKILQYEATPDDGDLDRFEKGLMACTSVPGISVKETKRWVRQKMLDNGFDTIDEQYYPGNGTAAGISNSINDGVSWVNYTGYANYYGWWLQTGDFTSDRVAALTNNDELPVVTSMREGTGNFDHANYDPCFGETWLRHGTPNSPKGAVAFIGPSELNTIIRWDLIMDGGWYRGLFDFDLRTLGQCMIAAKIEVANAYPDHWNENPGGGGSYNSVWFYWHTYNILGDPALQLRCEIPVEIMADHLEEVPQNSTFLRVETWADDENEAPVEGGRVVITNSEMEIIGNDLTDQDGIAYVYFTEPPTGEELEITITRPDMIPYTGTFNSAVEAGLALSEISMIEDQDDNENNNDDTVNPGELIIPAISFEIVEPEGIGNLTVTVSLISEVGEVAEESEEFGNVDVYDVITLSEPRIRINEDLHNEELIEIIFLFEGDGDFEQSHYVAFEDIAAPIIIYSDADYGESIVPGDTLSLSIFLANTHPDLGAGSVDGILSTVSEDVTVTDAEGSWTELPANDEAESNEDFEIVLNDSTYPGRELFFTLDLTTAEGYTSTIPFTLIIDGWDDENSPTGPTGPGYWFFEDNDDGYGYDIEFEYTSLVNDGDDIGINDNGNNGDEVVTVDIPFEFPYWDDTYQEITISSNGFFTFGETEFYFKRNRTIPGTLMPEAAVCVFWDDLASGEIYSYHDEEEGWFGIEWYNVQYTTYDHIGGGNPTGDRMKFQVRLLDPLVHGAPGGLGIIVLMYNEIDNGDDDSNYCTIGITSPDGLSGLQYEFNETPAPTATGVHVGLQIIIALGTDAGISRPDLSFSPPLIQISRGIDEELNASFEMSNVGGLRMTYRLWTEAIWHSWPLGNSEGALNVEGRNPGNVADNSNLTSGNELDDFGGPDDFGYIFYDSDESYGPVYEWIDIAVDSNEVAWVDRADPRLTEEIELPFTFPFYGEDFESIWITECGYVVFMDPNGVVINRNTPLPFDTSPFAGIYPFWEDIGIDEGGSVYAAAYQDSFVVTWESLHQLAWDADDGPYTFQMLITSDGAIHFQYAEMNPSFRSCTVGIQDHEAASGLEVVRYLDAVEYLHSNMSIRLIPPVTWFSLDDTSGRLAPGESITITLAGSTNSMSAGIYQARIIMLNETSMEADMLPITLAIYENEPGDAPQLTELPGESIIRGEEFSTFALDPYVYDPDNLDSEISWMTYGGQGITIEIDSNRVVHPIASEYWSGETSVIFRMWDPELNWVEQEVVYDTLDLNDVPRFLDASPDYYAWKDSVALDSSITLSFESMDPEDDRQQITWFYRDVVFGMDTTAVTVVLDAVGRDSVWVMVEAVNSEITHTWWIDVYSTDEIGADEEALPDKFALENVYPNPFNSKISVSYALPEIADVQLRVFNVLGREVAKLSFNKVAAGRHRTMIEAKNWSSGIYFLQWQAGGVKQVRKMVLLK